MICPKCNGEGLIIHHYTPFNPSHNYTEDCPLKCEAQQKLRATIDAKTIVPSQSEATNRLIAVAPELFDAVKKLLEPKEEGIFKPGICSPDLAALQMIVAKIEGNQNNDE